MPDPIKYQPSYSFSGFQANEPIRPLPGPRVDDEFANIASALGGTIDALGDLRRSDGTLQNGIVGPDALSPAIVFGFKPRGAWAAGVQYNAGDGVTFGGQFFSARSQHVSTADTAPPNAAVWTYLFAVTDVVISEGSITPAMQTPIPSGRLVGRLTAGNGPQEALTRDEARGFLGVADDPMPLLQSWDASDLGGLAQILYNIPDEFKQLEIRYSGLRSTVNASLFLLRAAVAPSGTPISTASAYQASIFQLRGTTTDTVSGSYSEFGLLDLSNSQSINHGVIRISPDNGHWRAQIFATGLNASDLGYVSMRHGRLNAGTLCRRVQLGFSAALAASGWIRFYGIR